MLHYLKTALIALWCAYSLLVMGAFAVGVLAEMLKWIGRA
jgi:hypothetical protein